MVANDWNPRNLGSERLVIVHVTITPSIIRRRHLVGVVSHVNKGVDQARFGVAENVAMHRVAVTHHAHVTEDGHPCLPIPYSRSVRVQRPVDGT